MALMDKAATTQVSELSSLDKALINLLQKGLPVCERPFAEITNTLKSNGIDTSEQEVIDHLNALRECKILTRFGPMFDAACLGGAFTLAALSVPEDDFEKVTEQVNSFEQIAHNYRRDHAFNMWFVIGTESQAEIDQVIAAIEDKTQLKVLNTPKLEEYYVGLYLPV